MVCVIRIADASKELAVVTMKSTSNTRMILKYLVPRIMRVLVSHLVVLSPGFVFLEATLGLFNIKLNFPTWERNIYLGL